MIAWPSAICSSNLRGLLVVLAGILYTTSCGDPHENSTAAERTRPSPGWRVSPAEFLFDSATGDSPAFFGIKAVGQLEDGSVVVVDGGNRRIVSFDPRTGELREHGGSGGGPGEFRDIAAAWFRGDTIRVWDARSRRYSSWTLPEGYLGSTTIDRPATGAPVGELAAGRLVVLAHDPHVPVPSGTLRSDSATLYRVERQSTDPAVMGRYPVRPVFAISNPAIGGSNMYIPLPFGPEGEFTVGDDRVYYAYGDEPSIAVLNPAGTRIGTLVKDGVPPLLSPGDIERWQEGMLERAPSPIRPTLRDLMAQYPYPERLPAFDTLLVDRLGYLWARNTSAPHGTRRTGRSSRRAANGWARCACRPPPDPARSVPISFWPYGRVSRTSRPSFVSRSSAGEEI